MKHDRETLLALKRLARRELIRNIAVSPIVLVVRFPIMLVATVMAKIADWADSFLPLFERYRHDIYKYEKRRAAKPVAKFARALAEGTSDA